MIRRIPVGVVGAITPWNSPSVLGMRVVAPALALGNAVILKPDPQTPVSGGAVFAAIFKEAGLPDGLLQIVIGDAETGDTAWIADGFVRTTGIEHSSTTPTVRTAAAPRAIRAVVDARGRWAAAPVRPSCCARASVEAVVTRTPR
jgi:benzaldehyde dehydrogenase (NAD)